MRSIGKGLGIGLAAVGRPAYINGERSRDLGLDRSVDALRRRTADVLDAAYAGGIRYVDTARSYGRAEEFLADWLASRPDVTDVQVASKWGYTYVGEWRLERDVHEVKDHSPAAYVRQFAETRSVLGDRLDVYQIHSLVPSSPALDSPELLAALGELRDSGVLVGFSTSGPSQADVVRRALDVTVGGVPLFGVVQSTWNLLEPSVGPALAEAADAGVDVVIKESLANGRLTPAEASGPVCAVAEELGAPVDELAMAVALAQPWVSRVLTGAVTPAQIARNLRAAGLSVAADISFPEEPGSYWATRSRRPWA
ncbi:aldo/keto reductase [Cryptosporangium sp. NPDC048952]|uniref:aldo/keto reductase n=1 Tax=Cryptosporangium sp. NPDC048952 TaxID=3363961 RepID=UPI0037153E79